VIHVIAERLDDLTPLLKRLAADTGCVEALANGDHVRRSLPERLPPPAVAVVPALHELEPEYADEFDPAAEVRAVMPKGRNFH
jgi:error-prone DNA polymerase